jgi:hypothetical protein
VLGDSNALGLLYIGHFLGRRFGHMDRPAANDRAACGQRRQFHKCHPSRHKNRFLFLWEPHLLCG